MNTFIAWVALVVGAPDAAKTQDHRRTEQNERAGRESIAKKSSGQSEPDGRVEHDQTPAPGERLGQPGDEQFDSAQQLLYANEHQLDMLSAEEPPQPVTSVPAFTPVGVLTAPHLGSFWRSRNNVLRITFDAGLPSVPVSGEILIQGLVECCDDCPLFEPDLSAGFSFSIEDGNVLRIAENGALFAHRHWYAVRNIGDWAGVAPFELHYVVARGDANGDGRVLYTDISYINTRIPSTPAFDQDRHEINGDWHVGFTDFAAANSYVPSDRVPKPCGH